MAAGVRWTLKNYRHAYYRSAFADHREKHISVRTADEGQHNIILLSSLQPFRYTPPVYTSHQLFQGRFDTSLGTSDTPLDVCIKC